MNVARLNMSHGDYNEHGTRLKNVRAAADITGKTVGVFADLQGPKIRLGRFLNDEKPYLAVGDIFTITIDDIQGTKERCSTTFKGLPGDVNVGDQILIDDGKVALKAIQVTDTDVVCETVVPGPVSNNKGINLPGVAVSVPALSDKDERDLRWALAHPDIDMIALSFVRSGEDIKRVHEIMDEEGRRLPVIAKLEKPQAIANLQEIIDSFDAFMVARGHPDARVHDQQPAPDARRGFRRRERHPRRRRRRDAVRRDLGRRLPCRDRLHHGAHRREDGARRPRRDPHHRLGPAHHRRHPGQGGC